MNKDEIEQHFAELAAENAALKARLAAVEAKTAAPKEATRTAPKAIDEGTRVTSYLAPVSASFVMPTPDELRQLMDIVLKRYPTLAPAPRRDEDLEDCEAAYFKSFCAAFRALGHMNRTEEPDRKHYLYHWTDVLQRLSRSLGGHTEISGPALICAALAHGDIPWTDGRVDGSVFELGLNEYIGKQATDAWRKVLRGEFLPPTPVPPSRQIQRSPARVW